MYVCMIWSIEWLGFVLLVDGMGWFSFHLQYKQDLASNPYFTDAAGEGDDIDLEQIMCEYENLFEKKETFDEDEEEEGEEATITPREEDATGKGTQH